MVDLLLVRLFVLVLFKFDIVYIVIVVGEGDMMLLWEVGKIVLCFVELIDVEFFDFGWL